MGSFTEITDQAFLIVCQKLGDNSNKLKFAAEEQDWKRWIADI